MAPAPTPADAAGKPIGEAHARVLLAQRFRAAGLRIRYDVKVSGSGFELTCDGYDPVKRVGFEYLDPSEAGTDLTARERAGLERDGRVLVVPACSAAELERRAEAFLAARLAAEATDAGTHP